MVQCSGQFDGTDLACMHLPSVQTQRLNSSLRGPRRPRRHCRAGLSGPNKTLFASFGPNSHGRDHRRRGRFLKATSECPPGRLKASRGHRYDGMPRLSSLTAFWDITHVPSDVFNNFDVLSAGRTTIRLSGFSRLLFQANGVGFGLMVRGLADDVGRLVAIHGKKNSEEPSGHRHIGLGFFAGGMQDALPRFFLGLIGTAEDDGSFSESPAKRGGTGFGDFSVTGISGGKFVVGCKSCPEFEGVGVGKSAEVTDLRGDDAGPDLVDAGDGLEPVGDRFESFGAVGEGDLQPEGLALTLEQDKLVEKIFEGLSRFVLEQVAEAEEPSVRESAVEFGRSGQIGGVQDGPHAVFDAGECSRQLAPVTSEFSQASGFGVGDPSERTLAPCQAFGDIASVVEIGLSTFAASGGEFGGVGDADEVDGGAESVDEPFDKTDGFDGHPEWPGQRAEKGLDFLDAFGVDGEFGEDVLLRIDRDECDGGFVQIDADEGVEGVERPERVRGMRVGNREHVFSFLSHEKDLHKKN